MGISFSAVTERDVDLLIVEELASDSGFREWFLSEVGLSGPFELIEIAHSVSDSSGESDIEVTVGCGTDKVLVLIEDKIDAPLQPRQAERYIQRAAARVRDGACDVARTVLVAPSKYLGDPPDLHGFEALVTYERIVGWFEAQPDGSTSRREYKLTLLRTAIERGTVGWVQVVDERVTEFCRRYWDLSRRLAPELNAVDPGDRARRSSWMKFKPVGLPERTELLHKLATGCVDLQIAGGAARLQELERIYGSRLLPGMVLEPANKSAVIRIHVASMDLTAPFENAEANVREALWAVRLLAYWARSS